ncbi:MAG: HD domain-containing protein [Candidatus Altiarchaeota archaeon]|nr:HD domain-containing protein [Candidatus Altiarchaeota archaeon]
MMELEAEFNKVFKSVDFFQDKEQVKLLLDSLKEHDLATYQHSLRVGLLSYKAAKEFDYDLEDMFIAGLLHDIGKIAISPDLLSKKGTLSVEEWLELEEHVETSYEMLKNDYVFCAEVIRRHHKYQQDSYPVNLPELNEGLVNRVNGYAPLLATLDYYDSYTTRTDARYPTKTNVKTAMLEEFPDLENLVEQLFLYGVLQN